MIALSTIARKVLANKKMIIIAVIAALATSTGYLKLRLDSVKADRKLLQYRVETTLDANETNQRTINALRERNDELVELMEISVARAGAEAAAAEAERISLVEERSRLQRELRDSLSGSPSCEDLAAIDISNACPAFADRVFGFYQRSRQD